MILLSGLALLAGMQRGWPQSAGPAIPLLWEPRERLAKPDLSALPRLRFLTTVDFPPFNSLDAQGRLVGFHIDLARAVCAELGVTEKCQIQALPWSELLPALLRGEGEAIIAGVAVTAEARETLGFSRPFLWFPARFMTRKDATPNEPLAQALSGKKIGVLAGSAHERMLKEMFPGLQPVPYPDAAALQNDLADAKLDAVFGDGMRFSFWLAEGKGAECCRFAGGPFLAPEYLGYGLSIAARRDDAELIAAFDYALQALSTKKRFTELYLRAFPVSFF